MKKVRYYSYDEFSEDGGYIVTVSEEDIRRDYYPYWFKRMCDKFGQGHVQENYSFEDCLQDWIITNWAWESPTNGD